MAPETNIDPPFERMEEQKLNPYIETIEPPYGQYYIGRRKGRHTKDIEFDIETYLKRTDLPKAKLLIISIISSTSSNPPQGIHCLVKGASLI